MLYTDIDADVDIWPETTGVSYPWTPLDLGASLKAWWNADDHGTGRMVDDGAGLISSWTDRVGGATVTGTTTARPTWTVNSFNSAYAGMTFDGVANNLGVTPVPASIPTGATAGNIIVLTNQTATTGICRLLNYGADGANARTLGATIATGMRLQISNEIVSLFDTAVIFSGNHIGVGEWAGTTMSAWLDGTAITPPSATMTTLATLTSALRMGARSQAATLFAKGVIRHVFVTLQLTTLQRQQLEGWLAWESGLAGSILAAGHPYKAAAPTITRAWRPEDLGASLKEWWSADDHGTANMVDDGAGLISSWKGRTSWTNPTATTTARPTWGATSFNSAYAGVTGDGVANCLRTTTFTALPQGATGGEIWLAVNSTGVVDGVTMIQYGAVGGTCRRLMHQITPRLQVSDGVATLAITSPAPFTGNFIVGANWAGTTQAVRINGATTTPASGVISSLFTPSTGALTLFAYNTGAALFGTYIIRHVIVTLTLTATEREKLEGWLAWDSGLTGNLPPAHPYKLVRP